MAGTGEMSESAFLVEPNPTSGQFKIHYYLLKDEAASWAIYDAIGHFINNGNLVQDSSFSTFEIGSNQNSIYTFLVETSSGKKMHWKISLVK
ncbi:hypothetical protein BH11BAC2_BH11BAC2_07120 [soil metagenome]